MTIIQIKYSTANTEPGSGVLSAGELAYSEVSKKLFIGNDFGTANVIGGQKYIDLLESNTSLSASDTIVIRDAQGSFSGNVVTANSFVGNLIGNLDGNADTATKLANNFTISLGNNATGSVNLDGSSNVTLNVTLVPTNVTSGSYGNTRFIPTFSVGYDGRITGVTNVAIDFPDSADFSQDSYNKANSAYTHANAAYATANIAIFSNAHANAAFNVANLIYAVSNTANAASSYANSGFLVANTANLNSVVAGSYANSAYQTANSAASYANGAFVKANTAILSYDHANASYNIANLALSTAVNTSLLLTEIFANVSATEDDIITTGIYANVAYIHANASFNTTNTKFNSSGGTISGDVNVTGNLTVTGNVTYVATNQLNLGDAVITLNADLGQSASPTENAGIEIERGRYQNASIIWNETLDRWQFTDNVSTSNIASASAEVYANAAFEAANSAYAFAGQATIELYGTSLAANAAGTYANTAFARSNAAFFGTTGSHANSAYAHANAAFTAANSATPQAVQSAFNKANAAYDAANVAYQTGGVIAGSYANSAFIQANAAFSRANAANNLITNTFTHANAAYGEANNATLIGLAAFALANSIQFSQGTEIAIYAWNNSNAAFDKANAAHIQANTATNNAANADAKAVIAGSYANSAFSTANTKLSAAGGTISGDLVVSGNLRVDGDRATFFVSAMSVEDNIIDIAADQIGTPTLNSGIRIIRGDETAVQLRWNEASDHWQFTSDGVIYQDIGARSGEVYANAAFGVANTANAHSISAFSLANTVNAIAQAAYDTANNAGSSTILQAAFNTANSAGSYANSAFGAANSAGSFANSALGAASTADQRAVTAGVFANGAFSIANVANEKAASGYLHANAAFNWANSSYDAANTKLSLTGGTLTGPLTVQGGVTIVGGLLYANSSTVLLADNIITLNAAIDQTSAPSFDAGIEVDRGTSDNVAFIWNEASDSWQFTNDGINYSNVASKAAEVYANSAFAKGNAAASHATSAYDQANTGTTLAQAAFNKANTGNITAQSAFDKANSAYELANGKSTFYFSSFAPGSANEGDRWIDADLGQEFIYVNDGDSLQWIELSAFVDQNLVDDNIYYVLGSPHTGSNLDTVQSIFGVSINLAANTVYEFEGSFALKKTSGTNPHSIGLGFAGSIGVNHVLYHVTHINSALNSASTPTSIMINTVSNTTVSSNTNVDNHNIFLKGTISVGSAGSFVPQYKLSDAPGAAFDTLAGSYFKMEPIGSANTNINVGSWS